MPACRSALAGLGIVSLVVSLVGCTRYYWSRPGATAEHFDQDNRECARETSANPTEATHGMVNEPLYRACLQARRWVRTKEFTPPPTGSYRGFE